MTEGRRLSKDYMWIYPPFVWLSNDQDFMNGVAQRLTHRLQKRGDHVENIQVWVCPAPVATCIPTLPRWQKTLFRLLGVKHLRWRTNVTEGRPI